MIETLDTSPHRPRRGRGAVSVLRTTKAALAVALVGGLLTVGCASGDDEASTTTTETSDTTGDATESTATTETSDSGASEEASGDNCDIVSDEVVSELLGIEIERREPVGEPGAQSYSCLKGSERSDDPADFNYVSVGVTSGVGAVLLDEFRAQEGAQPVDGLGDDALFLPSAGVLVVSLGGDAVQVQVVKNGVPAGLDDARVAMADVLDRL